MNLETNPAANCPIHAAVEKFYATNDNLAVTQRTGMRVFFEFLRTKPELSKDEIETIWSMYELVHDLGQAQKTK